MFFEFGDDLRVGKELSEVSLALPKQVLSLASHFAIRTVAHQTNDEAQPPLVCGFDGIIDDLESFGIENSGLRLQAEITSHTIAHGLRTHDTRSHHLGGIEDVIHLKV